jgi:hypothetical protein
MASKLLSVADAVVTLLNAQPKGAGLAFPLAFTATRVPVRIVALEDLSTLDVAVVTGEGTGSATSPHEGSIDRELEFNVEIRQRVDDVTDNAIVDPLVQLLEAMGDLILMQPGSTIDDNAFCRSASYAYAVTELEQNSLFVGVMTLTFGVIQ